jgi:capsular exopolysaccharide synthesis family protein
MASHDLVVSTHPDEYGDRSGNRLPALASAHLPQVGEADEEAVNWGRYLAAFKRYSWLMAIVVLIGTAAGILASRFMKPSYLAQATIWVETTTESGKEGPLRARELLNAENWIDLLRSSVVLDSVVVERRMVLQPEEAADSALFAAFEVAPRSGTGSYVLTVSPDGESWTLRQKGQDLLHGAAGSAIGERLGWTWAPSKSLLGKGRNVKFAVRHPREVSADLNKRLTASLPENGNFIRVTLESTDRQSVAPILNAICRQFVEIAADLKQRKLKEFRLALDSQVTQAHNSLREAEGRLRSFQMATITQPRNSPLSVAPGLVATQPGATAEYFNQKGQLELIRAERRQLETILSRGRQGAMVTDAYLTIAAVKGAPQLQLALTDLTKAEADYAAASRRYTAEHPLMVQLTQQIRQLRNERVPTLAQALVDQLKAQEGDLNSRIQSSGTALREVPAVTISEMRLQREYDAANDLYKMLAGRREEARLAELGALPDIRPLEEAVAPIRPSTNTAPRIIFIAFAGSLGLAAGLALLLDHLDRRFRYPEQVTNELGLTILGAVPACRKNRRGEIAPEQAQQVVEAFRTIRLNLAHSYGVAGPVTLTVTSPGAGDGKSFICSNLAVSFAQAGYRTLLIDGDIRRGELHRMFSVDRRPGLLDYLSGDASYEELVRPTSQNNLWVVPCGTRRHQGPELLGSAAMSGLMAWLKSRFNVIIIDSPPLGAGIDPFVLGTVTGHLIVAFRAGETDRQMAQAKLPLLSRLPVRILGAVLNEVEAGGVYRYYNYIYGYSSDEEPTAGQLTSGEGNGAEEGNGAPAA